MQVHFFKIMIWIFSSMLSPLHLSCLSCKCFTVLCSTSPICFCTLSIKFLSLDLDMLCTSSFYFPVLVWTSSISPGITPVFNTCSGFWVLWFYRHPLCSLSLLYISYPQGKILISLAFVNIKTLLQKDHKDQRILSLQFPEALHGACNSK